jgi:hypothetical protein
MVINILTIGHTRFFYHILQEWPCLGLALGSNIKDSVEPSFFHTFSNLFFLKTPQTFFFMLEAKKNSSTTMISKMCHVKGGGIIRIILTSLCLL